MESDVSCMTIRIQVKVRLKKLSTSMFVSSAYSILRFPDQGVRAPASGKCGLYLPYPDINGTESCLVSVFYHVEKGGKLIKKLNFKRGLVLEQGGGLWSFSARAR